MTLSEKNSIPKRVLQYVNEFNESNKYKIITNRWHTEFIENIDLYDFWILFRLITEEELENYTN